MCIKLKEHYFDLFFFFEKEFYWQNNRMINLIFQNKVKNMIVSMLLDCPYESQVSMQIMHLGICYTELSKI